jgi:hypothetical protein
MVSDVFLLFDFSPSHDGIIAKWAAQFYSFSLK